MSRRALPLLPLLVCACSAESLPIGGDPDAGVAVVEDASRSPDAAAGADATADIDAGAPAGDAGPADDAGPEADAGPTVQPGQMGLDITTASGPVRGVQEGNLRVFKGIPFAEPPVGARRFAPPAPVAPWTDVLEADDFGPSCAQPPLGPEFLLGDFAGPTSEDCLTLNIWAFDDPGPRPVMVFIYGGGFVSGGSAWPIYDAAKLARRAGAVVVTINYRLGLFGFLAHEALDDAAGVSGNYGIRDQIEALRWLRTNIVAFGGDRDNVTIFGESAGAISVCTLLGAPSADGLYHKAIMESGQCVLAVTEGRGPLTDKTIYEYGEDAVEEVGCDEANDVAQCLRDLPVETLAEVSSINGLISGDLESIGATVPHVDGVLVPEQPLARLQRGEADVPFIVGSNQDEGSLLAFSDFVVTWPGLSRAIEDFTGLDEDDADDVADLYPFGDFFTPNEAWLAFLGDITFVCPGISAAEAAAAGAPSFSYHFTRSPPLTRALGAGHGIELLYVFGNFNAVNMIATPADQRVIDRVQNAWGTFAARGQPDLDAGWPAFDPMAPRFAILDDPASVVDTLRNGRCDALRDLGLVW